MSDQPPHGAPDDSIHGYRSEAPPAPADKQFEQRAFGQQYYDAPRQHAGGTNTSAVVLTVVSALSCLVGIFPAGIPGLVLGIIALTKQRNDLPRSHKFSKIGWIVWSVVTVISIIAFVAWVASGNFQVSAASKSAAG